MDNLKININGKEVNAVRGQTILEVARQNGIEIPTLCYDERLKSYGGCGLCVVETAGSTKLFRSCATQVAPGMVISTDSPRVRESRKLTLELLLSDHNGDCRGPCVNACPAHLDVQGYVGLIANKQYREALALIKESMPIPASIGRVCPHPCETACRRQLVEEPISIAQLKYFAADKDLESPEPYLPEKALPTGKNVAIVGAGPAGLTAAYFLARAGHGVTVYDAMPQGGGMLRYGIPEYRLPKAVLDQEIELIEKMGVEFIYNTRVGVDISLDYLKEIYDAVFLGIGAWVSSSIRYLRYWAALTSYKKWLCTKRYGLEKESLWSAVETLLWTLLVQLCAWVPRKWCSSTEEPGKRCLQRRSRSLRLRKKG